MAEGTKEIPIEMTVCGILEDCRTSQRIERLSIDGSRSIVRSGLSRYLRVTSGKMVSYVNLDELAEAVVMYLNAESEAAEAEAEKAAGLGGPKGGGDVSGNG